MTKAEYRKARENLLVMLVCTLLVAALLFYVIPVLIKVPRAALLDDAFTPQTFPYFLGTVMAVCVVIGDIKYGIAYAKARKEAVSQGILNEKDPPKTLHERIVPFIPWIIYAIVVLYGYGINTIGFILPTIVLIPVVLGILKCKKWQYYLYVYLFAAAMWAIFKFALNVQLP